jgi:hypothetical protein
MAKRYTGRSDAMKDPDAGFRRAAQDAVDKYKDDQGEGKPVRLRVAGMYVEVQNPIHGYIVELEPER